jgi:hypothetical protein
MGLGLITYGWFKGRLDILERHAWYGKDHNWVMGESTDGRSVYTPAMVGILYQAIYALGGENSANRLWPNTYSSGLIDYQAHLQVLGIFLRGEISKGTGDADAVPAAGLLGISQTMYQRLREHHEREPQCPFYALAWGMYSGDLQAAVDILRARDRVSQDMCQYMRPHDTNADLGEWIFAASHLLEFVQYGH